ncbi:MAG: short-chain fatty acid transporter, partial [Candidatus Latescibacteria bacterium]|nr:short-chain fatty acid transporter [Candidatus Latescibacterota bacterium]
PPDRSDAPATTFAERVERSRAIGIAVASLGLVWVVHHFATRGAAGLDLDTMNATFLFLGILLHGRPIAYVRAVDEAVRGVAGIILQFPFYAGIMGIMKYTGLIAVVSGWFVAAAGAAASIGVPADDAFAIGTFLSAGIVNLFVPSGGGQWAVQGPILLEAGRALGVGVEKTILALSYGDEWTNMLQPFWALPLLGITGLKGGQILGYTAALMILVLPLYLAVLVLF